MSNDIDNKQIDSNDRLDASASSQENEAESGKTHDSKEEKQSRPAEANHNFAQRDSDDEPLSYTMELISQLKEMLTKDDAQRTDESKTHEESSEEKPSQAELKAVPEDEKAEVFDDKTNQDDISDVHEVQRETESQPETDERVTVVDQIDKTESEAGPISNISDESVQVSEADVSTSDIPVLETPSQEKAIQTLEEKRKKQIENKVTIEEKRKQQRIQSSKQPIKEPSPLTTYWQNLRVIDLFVLVLSIVCLLMSGYIAILINRYFGIGFSLLFFVVMTLLNVGVFLLHRKKQKAGLLCHVFLSVLLAVGSFATYRLTQFSDKIFDNTESESVMIVVKKDSKIQAEDDFSDMRIAMVEADTQSNAFAEEILSDEGKKGYRKTECKSYVQAYEQLMNGDVELMVFTNQAQQRLAENDIDARSQVTILFSRNREREAVKSKAVDITKDPFTVLVSGVDLSGENINEKGNSDVNILVSVNPQTKKAIMHVVPRDSWAALPCLKNEHTKLTYAGSYGGIDCSIQAIEQYFDIEINYYAKINFQGVMDLVDAMGGITIENDIAFCTSYKDRNDDSSQVCFQEGTNRINGAQALIYSRVRKIFSEGDIARGRHQMIVINGVINEFGKSASIGFLNQLLGVVESNFTTNFREDEIVDALDLFFRMKAELSNMKMYTMEGEMRWNDDEVSGEYLYYFYPDDGERELVKERILQLNQ